MLLNGVASGRCLTRLMTLVVLCLLASPAGSAQGRKRPIAFADLPPSLHEWIAAQGVKAENFSARLDSINRETVERVRDGEFDHLIHYILQSKLFTRQPRIEPAVSAYEFVQNLDVAERAKYLAEDSTYLPPAKKIPDSVRARIKEFAGSSASGYDDPRWTYFQSLLSGTAGDRVEKLLSEYARAMRFLYRKEFASRQVRPEEVAAYVSALYQTRGHSTDTQVEANFAVFTALSSLPRPTISGRIDKVLIVGPGHDLAPRVGLIDDLPPQSFQPFAVADALLQLGFSDRRHLRIHGVDINQRVVDYLQKVSQRPVDLVLVSGLADNESHRFTDEFREYFRSLGQAIGVETEARLPRDLAGHLRKVLTVNDTRGLISGDNLNIVTERYEIPRQFDLVVVTNVFPYFNRLELLLALTNISSMLKPGGYLIHNELQNIPALFMDLLGLPLEQARTILIASSKTAPLYDGVAIHRKK